MSVIDTYYNETIGKWIEMDGAPSWDPYQCADYFKHACKRNLGYHWATGGDGYVDNWWYNRQAHASEFAFITDSKQLKNGDFVIWGHGSRKPDTVFPLSHVAMYYNGYMVGANQYGHKEITAVAVDNSVWANMLGAFRFRKWKGDDGMELVNGLQKVTHNNKVYHVYKGYGDMRLYMISALGGDHATQDITAYDHDDLTIYAIGNCNYFQMSQADYGQHYGVEQSDGDKVHSTPQDLVPPQAVYHAYWENQNGSNEYVEADKYDRRKSDVRFACSPYSIRFHKGKEINDISKAFANKEDYVTNQTAYFKLKSGEWCIAVSESKVVPQDIVDAMKSVADIEEMFITDGGGSSQLWAWDGKQMTKALYTGRQIPNVLCLAKPRPVISKPVEEPSEPVIEPVTPDPVIDEPVVEEPKEDTKPIEEPKDDSEGKPNSQEIPYQDDNYLFKMSNKVYDTLRFISHIIPYICTFLVAISTQIEIPNLMTINTILLAFVAMLDKICDKSTIGYHTKKNGGDS